MKKIGFIGLGIMGSGMAGQLLEKGYELTVWNRDPSKAAALVKRGAGLAESPSEMAANVEVIITMVRDDAASRQVIMGEQGALSTARPGTFFIDMSTVTPMLARELALAVQNKGCVFLDAPVTGSKEAAASGKLNILVGGQFEDLEAQRDVLEAMSQSITHIGPNGTSAIFKLANNQLIATLMAAMGESLALCEAAGLSRELVVETLAATITRASGLKKTKIINQDWSTDFALDLMHKDMTQTMEAANAAGVPMPVLAAAREKFQQARRDGMGQQDFSCITG